MNAITPFTYLRGSGCQIEASKALVSGPDIRGFYSAF
jgi:hypothetical protein